MADEKKKNSFRDMILIVFVVLMCFGLTIYGIVYLTGKVFSNDEKIEIAKIKSPKVTTDPEQGDILTFSAKPETVAVPTAVPAEQPAVITPMPEPTPTTTTKVPQYTPKVIEEKKPEKPKPVVKEPEKTTPKVAERPQVAFNTQPKSAYAVQLLAVKTRKNAEEEAARFKNSCPSVFIQKADLGSKGTWFRVRCNPTDSKSNATQMKNKINSQFKGISSQVVSNR